jgi:hypothetical protein
LTLAQRILWHGLGGGGRNKQPCIAWLQGLHSNGEVLAWDPEEQEWYPVTGATYDGHEIQLYTDEDGENSTVWGSGSVRTKNGAKAVGRLPPKEPTFLNRPSPSFLLSETGVCWDSTVPRRAQSRPLVAHGPFFAVGVRHLHPSNYPSQSSHSALASCKSAVSNPSVNQA